MKAKIPDPIRNNALTRILFHVSAKCQLFLHPAAAGCCFRSQSGPTDPPLCNVQNINTDVHDATRNDAYTMAVSCAAGCDGCWISCPLSTGQQLKRQPMFQSSAPVMSCESLPQAPLQNLCLFSAQVHAHAETFDPKVESLFRYLQVWMPTSGLAFAVDAHCRSA